MILCKERKSGSKCAKLICCVNCLMTDCICRCDKHKILSATLECQMPVRSIRVDDLLEYHNSLKEKYNSCVDGIKKLRGKDMFNGIEKDERFPVQILYKAYLELQTKINQELNKELIFTSSEEVIKCD